MENKLPMGWVKLTLKEVVDYKKGKKPKNLQPSEFKESVPYLDIKTIEKGIVGQYADKATSNITNENEILVVWDGARSGWVGKAIYGAIGSTLMAIKPKEINKEYLFRYLQTQFEYVNSNPRGTGIPHVDPEIFWNIKVPIPPIEEQNRIVAKLDSLLEKVAASKSCLDKIPMLLKNFRQSVLAAAVSGELTKEWRKLEFNRVNAEIQLDLIKKKFQKNSTDNDSVVSLEIIESIIPESWTSAKLKELFYFIDYRGKTPKKSQSGKRLITAKNIRKGYVSNEPVEFVSEDLYESWMTRGFPKLNDIFFVTEGHTMGFAALNKLEFEFAVGQRIITLQPKEGVSSEVFFYFILSPQFQKLIEANSTGTAAVGIKGSKLKMLILPFPTLEEQKEIVRKVKDLFQYADAIEVRYQKAKTWFDKIPQAILAKAFRGEIVPQDENDEPAIVMLERLKAEKATSIKSKETRYRHKQLQ